MSLQTEIRNNIAHITTGFIVGCSALALFGDANSGIIFAALTGFGVESYQLIIKREPWWIVDRFLDLMGYIAGGAGATYLFIKAGWII
jgi:hypothetical protein